uniref:Coenzyme Q7 homolog, ubiquinone (yeast) n=2 Tax=Cyprinus carpio TaxID=7962 RepID=A0A9J8CNM2_CYPCA
MALSECLNLSIRRMSLPPPRDEEEKAMLDSMLRVDHAGEYGANRIYAGQMAVLGRTLIQYMWDQEKMHLEKFNKILGEHRVRQVGEVVGSHGLMVREAMACTVAVEESISEHYNSQIRTLMEAEPERYTELLQASIFLIKMQKDGYLKCTLRHKLNHHDTGLEHDVPGYLLLKTAIQVGCKAAIYILQRI